MANYYPQLTHTTTDAQLISLWLRGKRRATRTSYAAVIRQFQSFIGDKGLGSVVLEDILLWLGSLELRGFTANTINQRLAAIRSLFAFACKCGYLPVSVALGVKTQPPSDVLHERILEQEEVKKLIGAAHEGRDRLLLQLLYATGLRVSEVCSLNWSDLKPRPSGGQATVIGKGGKARTVLIGQGLWQQLLGLERSEKTSAVFVSRTGRRLERSMLHKIIKDCASRAGVNPHVSAHWLRHAHALKLQGQVIPLTGLFDTPTFVDMVPNSVLYEQHPELKQRIFDLFSTSHSPASAATSLKQLLCCLPLLVIILFSPSGLLARWAFCFGSCSM